MSLRFKNFIGKRLSAGSKRDQNIKKNIAASLVIKGCSIVIQLMLVPMTLHYLDANLYGIWLTLSSIVLWLSFFDIGFSLGLKNRLAAAVAVGDLERGRQLVSTTYGVLLAIFIPLCVALQFVIPHINWSHFLNVSQVYNQQITLVMHVLLVCACIQFVVNTIGTVLAAFQKVAISYSFPVIGNFLSIIIVYVLTRTTEPSMLYLSLTVSFAPVLVMFVASIYLYHTKLQAVRPSLRFFNKALIKDIFSLGIKFFIINIQVLVMYQATNILISNISSPADVTAYNIAYKYLSTVLMVLTLALGTYWPAFTEAYTKGDFPWMRRTYQKLCKIFLCVLLAVVVMALCAPWVYKIWVGSATLVPSSMTLLVGLYVIVCSWQAIQNYLINGIGKVKLQTVIMTLGMFVHIPLSLFLGKYIGGGGVVASMTFLSLVYGLTLSLQLKKILTQTAKGIWLK